MSKFEEVLKENGISADAVVAVSRELEARSAEDRVKATKRRFGVRAGKKVTELGIDKPKLGRGATQKSVHDAAAGQTQRRVVRSKLLRAVNVLLKRKKKSELSTIDLFGDVKRRRGNPPAKKQQGAAG